MIIRSAFTANGFSVTAATPPRLSVVVPVYKEERAIVPFLQRLEATLAGLNLTYEILFCLDPSPDRTEQVIGAELQRNPRIGLIVLSRRFGQPAATMAGILMARGEACVVIDVDLQDPPEVIPRLYAKMAEGYEVVYARRRSRKGETLTKRLVAYVAYAVINALSDVEIPRDTGDFRIMSRRVIEELRRLNETHGFLRGLVAYVGFRQAAVEYDRDSRSEGTGNYNRLTGSWRIGMNGIVGFSTKPLQLIWIVGAAITAVSACAALWDLIVRMIGPGDGVGLSGTVFAVGFFSGLQLFCLGLTGEYIGRIYDEVKRRPPFIIDRMLNVD
jgi:glycosyltransferase involved in cell wall biosynthesis